MKNSIVIRPNGTASAEQARQLLRRFRDLNLGPCGIEVSERGRVIVAGCLSLDHPVENGVRYCLQDVDGERVLRIHWSQDQLRLQLSPANEPQAKTPDELGVPLSCDGLGRVSAPQLGARIQLEEAGALDIEHFLRRIVRAVYSQAS